MDPTNQQNIEEKWYRFWEEKGFLKADPNSTKQPYSLLMPPPNVNGELHLGHAMQHSILDAIARFKRMQGFDVLLQPGVDHAGILFEGTFNKILAKENLSKYNLSREEWLKKAWQFKEEIYTSFHDTWKIMGISADWSREVFTLDSKVSEAVLEEFKTLWEQDLLYKGAYIVQWCPKCGTAIEDLEMEYQEKKEKLYYVKYAVVDNESTAESLSSHPEESFDYTQDDVGIRQLADCHPTNSYAVRAGRNDKIEYITVATARPETIYADSAIAIYPDHPKYNQYDGKQAINPLNKAIIPIIVDERVEKDFGTGALKITPGHDLLDFAIGKDFNLPILHAVDKSGKMTELTEDLAGLKVLDARKLTEEKLEKLGALEKVEEFTHSVPVCERCKTTVEPLISEEWFIKMKPLAENALKNLDQIDFLPKNYHKIISDWLREIHDWSISRSLWWGHRIPVWYCQACNPKHEVGKDKDMVISLEKPDFPCKTCQAKNWVQDNQVLDTWFSSGLWPIATLGWPFNTEQSRSTQGKPSETKELKRYFPWDFELTAPDIKFLWIARMIMLSLWFVKDIPFKNMFFHGTLRDLQGRKFSKSLGNGISPYDLVKTWGVDATRMTLYSYSAPGRDAKTSRQIMDERCRNFRNFSTKINNIFKFVIDLKPDKNISENNSEELRRTQNTGNSDNLIIRNSDCSDKSFAHSSGSQSLSESFRNNHSDDQWIIDELNKTIKSVTKNLETFQLHLATEEIYEFIWHKFADIYIEKSKTRRIEAQPVLEYVLKVSLELLHPFMPFLTEDLWQKITHEEGSIMLTPWPEAKP